MSDEFAPFSADPDRACEHEDFAATVEVNRLTEVDGGPVIGYNADVHIACARCGEPFRFVGVPAGLMRSRPACSVDETELRLPIRPASSDPDFGLGIPGYAVTYRDGGVSVSDRAGTDTTRDELALSRLSEVNRARCKRWHDSGEPWSGADWSNAMCGEAGELANVVKKLRRHETGFSDSYNTPERDVLIGKLADEVADVLLYLDLVANHYGLDLTECVVPKFNRVSEAQGFPERLP